MRTLTLVAIAVSFVLTCGAAVDQREHEKEHHPCKDCRRLLETIKQVLPTLEGTPLVIFDSAIRAGCAKLSLEKLCAKISDKHIEKLYKQILDGGGKIHPVLDCGTLKLC
ncbi:hypothetical protein AAVH_31123 [Aphelenchoides avenae]|nr:hypothetical protein AAVH_31123 [Aphelenchus avenae]